MIKKLKNLPESVLGFEFTGEVTDKDYETVIYPEIENYTRDKKKIRVLCHFDKGFEKFDIRALLDDTIISFKHLLEWEKVALVSDVAWINSTFKALSFLMPGKLFTFKNDKLEKAIKWIEAK